ncbi:porin family protein [Pedobacter heparinus]|uniref:porin family protein n=1 Tax=Pedobacter heparinus TaxID=984 RepID=UPI00292CBADA|nr:porin family protein [Pedobacter heparinus]
MKKLLLSIILVAATFFAVNAQNTMTSKDARFGIKAGVNLSRFNITTDKDLTEEEQNIFDQIKDYQKSNLGFSVTLYGDFGLANNLALQPAVAFQTKGSKFETDNEVLDGYAKVNLMYIDVPINLVYSIPASTAGTVQISAGPYIGFAVSGKFKTKVGNEPEETEDIKFGDRDDDQLSGMDYGANVGLGFRMSNGLAINANYGLGLANILTKSAKESSDSKINNRVLGFTLGYSF